MGNQNRNAPRALILFYSFSGQTSGLMHRLADGLVEGGVGVVTERLRTVEPLRFPIGTVKATLKMMFTTFWRRRVPIYEPGPECFGNFDLVIPAGPTWSYNPSGPILALLDNYGERLFKGRQVIPLISCRGYWRVHWYGLRRKLIKCGARVVNKIIFTHPDKEPLRTIGVFLKLAGKSPERSPFWRRFYKHYGHSREQMEEAYKFGLELGEALRAGRPLSEINFMTPGAAP